MAGRGARVLVGVVIAAAVVGGAAYLKWAATMPPKVADGRVYPQPNGYDACRAATAGVGLIDLEAEVWKDGHDAEQRRLLAEYAADIQALRRAVRLEYMNPPTLDFVEEYPFKNGYRNGARLLAMRARHALRAGRTGEAVDYALDAVELGSRVGRGGSVIVNLIGAACSSIGLRSFEGCLPHLSGAEAARARRRLVGLTQRFPTAAAVMKEERRAWYGTLEGVFTGRISTAGEKVDPEGVGSVSFPDYPWSIYPKPWIYAESEALFAAADTELKKARNSRKPVPVPGEPLSQRLHGTIVGVKWADALAANQARLRLLVLDLALREHRGATGSYPAALSQLRPKLEAELQFDPLNGGPFRYRRTPQGFLLYSVGPDGKDDGGQPVSNRDVLRGGSGDLVSGQFYSSRPSRDPK